MKKLNLSIILVVLLFSTGCIVVNFKKEEVREDYSQAIGLNPNLVSKMFVGLSAPNGWEYTTEDKTLINTAISFLQKQTYIKKEKPKSTGQPEVGNSPFYRISFSIKDSQKSYNISFDSYNWQTLGLEIYEKTTVLEEKYYLISASDTDIKNLFDSLKEKKPVSLAN